MQPNQVHRHFSTISGGQVVVALVDLKEGVQVSSVTLFDHLRTVLARYKVSEKERLRRLPKTATGKIQNFKLRERTQCVSWRSDARSTRRSHFTSHQMTPNVAVCAVG
jgi:acyl-coenzyme A synthetase/AMP-(fatty) acid ligase